MTSYSQFRLYSLPFAGNAIKIFTLYMLLLTFVTFPDIYVSDFSQSRFLRLADSESEHTTRYSPQKYNFSAYFTSISNIIISIFNSLEYRISVVILEFQLQKKKILA